MYFAKNLHFLRETNCMEPEKLAYELGVPLKTIIEWEFGTKEPDIRALVQISRFFEVTLDDLILHSIPRKLVSLGEKNLKYLCEKHGITDQQISKALGGRKFTDFKSLRYFDFLHLCILFGVFAKAMCYEDLSKDKEAGNNHSFDYYK